MNICRRYKMERLRFAIDHNRFDDIISIINDSPELLPHAYEHAYANDKAYVIRVLRHNYPEPSMSLLRKSLNV